jgi:hypothetical protein
LLVGCASTPSSPESPEYWAKRWARGFASKKYGEKAEELSRVPANLVVNYNENSMAGHVFLFYAVPDKKVLVIKVLEASKYGVLLHWTLYKEDGDIDSSGFVGTTH